LQRHDHVGLPQGQGIRHRQGQNIDDFPNLRRWHAAIRARPATERAYARANEVNLNPPPVRSEEERRILFGQDRSVVK
jgi:GST-like protein